MAEFGVQATGLTDPNTRSAEFQARPTRNDTAAIAVKGIQTGLEAAVEIQDTGTKQDLAKDLGAVEQQRLSFQEEEAGLVQDITEYSAKKDLSETDREELEYAEAKLKSLHKGQQAGTLSPSAAKTHMNSLLREAQQRNPWIASDLNTIAKAYVGSTGAGKTPEQKAMDDLREQSAKTGISVSRLIRESNKQFEREAQKAEYDAKLVEGSANVDDLTLNNYNHIIEETGALWVNARAQIKENPAGFDSTLFSNNLALAEQNSKRNAYARISAAASNGLVLSQAQKDSMLKDVENQYKLLNDMASSNNPQKYLEQVEAVAVLNSKGDARKNNANYASLRDVYGADVAADILFKHIPAAQKALAKGMDQFQLSLEAGDESAWMAKSIIDGNGIASEILYKNIRDGKNVQGGEKTLTNVLASNVVNTPIENATPESSSWWDQAAAFLYSPNNSTKELGTFLTPTAQLNMTNKTMDGIKERMLQAEVTIRSEFTRTAENAPKIMKNENGYYQVYSKRHSDGQFVPSFSSQISRNRDLIDSLNTMTKLNKTYGMKDPGWEAQLLKDINTVPVKEKPSVLTGKPADSTMTDEEYTAKYNALFGINDAK